MQGPNFLYNNSFIKDMNQSVQGGLNKQGKKSNYKYYKGEGNKNNQNNSVEEKINMSTGENNQNYPHYNNRQNRKNYQENNSNINPPYKKKKQKKRDNKYNDFQFQSNNTTDLSQSSKEDYLEQQQQNNASISNNSSHQNIYNKQYKKNQMIYNNANMNNNEFNNIMSNLNINNIIGNFYISNMSNSNNNNNLNNPNLTPQRRNQITNPFGFNQNLSNNKNMNNQNNFNLNNLNHVGNSCINPMITQQNKNHPPSQNQIYINPNNNLLLMDAIRHSLSMNDNNGQEMPLNVEKSSENLSEDIVSTRGGNPSEASLQINKNNNDFISHEMNINNRYFHPNFLSIPYNMNSVNSINNSLGNINNINNLNNLDYSNINNINKLNNLDYSNINNIQNVSNYNQNITNQINNINNLNSLSMGNFQLPVYDQLNNPLYSSVIASNMKNNYSLSMNNDEINNHKKIKKIPNKSPKEKSFTMNAAMSLGDMLPNLNYNGPNINNNLLGNNNKNISLSSQAPKNTVPNFNKIDNLNFPFNQNKINQQGISPLLNMNNFGNKNYHIQQNMKNVHKNNNIWNNLNNSNNNNKYNNGSNNDNFSGNKSNIFNKKDFQYKNNNNNYNNNYNNKKLNKLYNYNTHQTSNINNNNHINNSGNKNNKLKQNNIITDNNNLINNYNGQNTNGNILRNNKPQKKYLLSLCLKFSNKDMEILNFKALKDTNGILQKVKEKRNLNDKVIKLIQMKINKAVQIIKQVYELNLNKYTYKNLANINYQIINSKIGKEKETIKINRSKSLKEINKLYGNEMKVSMNDVKQVEMLNISY